MPTDIELFIVFLPWCVSWHDLAVGLFGRTLCYKSHNGEAIHFHPHELNNASSINGIASHFALSYTPCTLKEARHMD